MAIVPNYKRSARLTPRYQRNIEVSASAEHMGAAIGRGLKGLGQGIGTAGKALHAAARLDNAKAQAKEREQQDQQDQMAERERQTRVKNQLSESMEKNRADVQKIAQGFDAYVDDPDLKDFGSTVDDVRRVEGFLKTAPKDEAASIRPGMEAIQVNASNRANQLLQEQALKNGQQADERYLDNFVQEAVTDRNDPVAVEKYRLAGLANIRASAERDGLDEGEAVAMAHAYSSKLDKDVVLAKLEDDPALALEDYDQLRPRLIETDRQDLDRTFSFVRKEEEVKSQISGILSLRRHDTNLSVSRQTSMPKGESDQSSISSVPLTYLNLASPIADRRLDQKLTPTFATNLDALMEDAQQQIGTGLEILPYQDRIPIKPDGESDYWSVQQGQNKVLLRYQGQSLSKAPSKVQDWLADNAGPYGLFMPVGSTSADSKSPETRRTDGFDRVLVASLDSPSSRALGPSAKQMEQAVSAIDNPDLQEAARANLQINLDRQSKQDKAGQLNATRELWAAIDEGKSLDDVPISIRVAAGSATLADATDFIRAREGGKIIQTDAVTLSELNRMMASNPDRFIGQDLDAYRNLISRNDLKELKQHQTDLLKQDSQALKRTELYKATFEQADQLLQQLGRSTTGPNGKTDPEVSRLNAQFFVNLKNRVDYELDRNEGQALNGIQIYDLIKKQLQTDFPDRAMQLEGQEDQETTSSVSAQRQIVERKLPKEIGEQQRQRNTTSNAAKTEGLKLVRGDTDPTDFPPELKQQIGPEGMNALEALYENLSQKGDVSDAVTHARLLRLFADNPDEFAAQDLYSADILPNLSQTDHEALIKWQNALSSDPAFAQDRARGDNADADGHPPMGRANTYRNAFLQTDEVLTSLGLTEAGLQDASDGDVDLKTELARLHISLAKKIEQHISANNGEAPDPGELRDMIDLTMRQNEWSVSYSLPGDLEDKNYDNAVSGIEEQIPAPVHHASDGSCTVTSSDGVTIDLTSEETKQCLQVYLEIAKSDPSNAGKMARWLRGGIITAPLRSLGMLAAFADGPVQTGKDQNGNPTYLRDNRGRYIYKNEITDQYFLGNPETPRDPATFEIAGSLAGFATTSSLSRAALSQMAKEERLLWTSWDNYPKVTKKGPNGRPQEYAIIGGRLYSRHAVAHMQPNIKGVAYWDGNNWVQGRSIPPNLANDIIRFRNLRLGLTKKDKKLLPEVRRLYKADNVEIVTSFRGRVITVKRVKGE